MMLLTVSANGEERDVTASDISSLSIEGGIVMVKLRNAKEKFSVFVSGIKLVKTDSEDKGRNRDGIK